MNLRDHISPLAIIAGLMLLLFCTEPARSQDRTIALPVEATDYEQAKVLQAVNEWNAALAGAVRWVLIDRRDWAKADWQISFDSSKLVERDSACETHFLERRIYCNPRSFVSNPMRPTPCNFAGTISHELGHAVGLQHIDSNRSLMRSTCPIYQVPIDAETLAQVRRIYPSISERK
jgi:predicted Zn-dependent protease